MLKACLNGARQEHPALPVTADELARDAYAVHLEGVEALHLHVKDATGADTLDAGRLAEVLHAVPAAVPLPVGVRPGRGRFPTPPRGWPRSGPGRRCRTSPR